MKKSIAILMLAALFFTLPMKAYASAGLSVENSLPEGCYIETIIIDSSSDYSASEQDRETRAGYTYTTKTKVSSMKDSGGNVLWSVTIIATFRYNGTESLCTSCTPSAMSYSDSWTIKSISSSKSGNHATAYGIATKSTLLGAPKDYSMTVTLSCSPNGTIS